MNANGAAPEKDPRKQKVPTGPAGIAALAILLIALLAPSEGGRRLTPYLDSVGIPTACSGIIGPEITRRYKAHEKFTEDECKALEAAYVSVQLRAMQRCIPKASLERTTTGEFLAYAHWSYNTGTNAFCGNSGVHRALVANDHHAACRAMGNWTYVTYQGKKRNCREPALKRICGGIPKRRDYEVRMCLDSLEN